MLVSILVAAFSRFFSLLRRTGSVPVPGRTVPGPGPCASPDRRQLAVPGCCTYTLEPDAGKNHGLRNFFWSPLLNRCVCLLLDIGQDCLEMGLVCSDNCSIPLEYVVKLYLKAGKAFDCRQWRASRDLFGVNSKIFINFWIFYVHLALLCPVV